jgi:signal transduction histidine kinase
MIEVCGALLNGFYSAGKNIRLLLEDYLGADLQWDPAAWYPVSELQRLINHSARFHNPGAVIERLGEEMMSAWYRHGPGRQVAPGALDFVRFQSGSLGYRSVMRSDDEPIGEFALVSLDERAGLALIRSTTVFCRNLELGLLNGGLQASGELLFFEVRLDADRAHFELRFVTDANRASLSWAGLRSAEEWRQLHLLRQFERREAFWVSISDTLHDAMVELKSTQQQLFLKEKMASLGTLTAGIAHEINNPTNFAHAGAQGLAVQLSAFRCFLLELAGDDADPAVTATLNTQVDQLASQVEIIQEGTSRIRNLVRDLRTFSRLDEADMKSVLIGDSLTSTINLVRTQYADIATIHCALLANPVLECWPAQLNQVFMNLIVNACQAIEKKQRMNGHANAGRLDIRSEQRGQTLLLEFMDDGCGMPETLRKRIFEPFFTTKAVGEGTGLGLSISFDIIAKHGGTIHVASQENVGSRFTIELPLSGPRLPQVLTSSPG